MKLRQLLDDKTKIQNTPTETISTPKQSALDALKRILLEAQAKEQVAEPVVEQSNADDIKTQLGPEILEIV